MAAEKYADAAFETIGLRGGCLGDSPLCNDSPCASAPPVRYRGSQRGTCAQACATESGHSANVMSYPSRAHRHLDLGFERIELCGGPAALTCCLHQFQCALGLRRSRIWSALWRASIPTNRGSACGTGTVSGRRGVALGFALATERAFCGTACGGAWTGFVADTPCELRCVTAAAGGAVRRVVEVGPVGASAAWVVFAIHTRDRTAEKIETTCTTRRNDAARMDEASSTTVRHWIRGRRRSPPAPIATSKRTRQSTRGIGITRVSTRAALVGTERNQRIVSCSGCARSRCAAHFPHSTALPKLRHTGWHGRVHEVAHDGAIVCVLESPLTPPAARPQAAVAFAFGGSRTNTWSTHRARCCWCSPRLNQYKEHAWIPSHLIPA